MGNQIAFEADNPSLAHETQADEIDLTEEGSRPDACIAKEACEVGIMPTSGNSYLPTVEKTVEEVESASIVILTSGLLPNLRADVRRHSAKLAGAIVVDSWDGARAPTHLLMVTKTKDGKRRCKRTLKYLQAVARGIWVVDVRWLQACVNQESHVSEGTYEVHADHFAPKLNGPSRARNSTDKQRKQLFQNKRFFIENSVKPPHARALADIARLCGAIVLQGCSTDETRLIPPRNHSGWTATDVAADMSVMCKTIIISTSKQKIRPIVRQSHGKSKVPIAPGGTVVVRAAWLFDCVNCFELLDCAEYQYETRLAVASLPF